MKNKRTSLFMPGRLCLIGEHSDWAASYRSEQSIIEKGYALTTKLDVGIYASIKKSNIIKLSFLNENYIECININELKSKILENDFWKYALSACSYMINNYNNVFGIEINIENVTLPMKKGLGSSAAIILLIIRAYNIIYNLNLDIEKEMDAAYISEINIGSKCGRLDQIGVIPSDINLMIFDEKNSIKYKNIFIKNDIYMVIADLKKNKDTIRILRDLNKCYPYAHNEKQKKVHYFLGKTNKEYILKCRKLLERGNTEKIGELFNEYQKDFDEFLIPVCSELKAPFLHKVLLDNNIKKYIYGGKGCGSGGDGAVQFIAKNDECQKQLSKYLTEVLHLDTIQIKIKSSKIKKAIIPIGGFGKRMYPMTKLIGKEFLPVMDKDNVIKPAILILLDELIEAGIEQIGLILPKENKKNYLKLLDYNSNYSDMKYEKKLKSILNKIVFIDDRFQDGVSHAIDLAKKFIGNDDFMFLLGDQLYKSYSNTSCINQILNFYYKHNCTTISCCKTELSDVFKYGILYGNKIYKDYFKILDFVEKPTIEYAKEKLEVDGAYYSIFGCYIFKNSFLNYVNKNKLFTDSLREYLTFNNSKAFIPNGKYYDIGNMKNYYETFNSVNGSNI